MKDLDEQGPAKFADKYSGFSIDSYLKSLNMSRAAIDYISLMFDLETNFQSSIIEILYDMNIHRSGII